MVRVRVCARDGTENPVNRIYCERCNAMLDQRHTQEASDPLPGSIAVPQAAQGRPCPNPVCGESNEPGVDRCVYCFTSLEDRPLGRSESDGNQRTAPGLPSTQDQAAASRRIVVEFPWGDVEVGKTLVVGRDAESSSLATELIPFDNVSRIHAEISVDGDSILLVDRGSGNGTFVNERQVPPGVAVLLSDGDHLRFARDLRATVKVRQDQR